MFGITTKLPFALLMLLVFSSSQLPQSTGKNAGNTDNSKAPRKDSKEGVGSAPPAPVAFQCETNQPQLDTDKDKGQENQKPVHNWVDLLNSISTAVVAAFTIAMVFVVWSQNRATKLAQRAWVVADFEPPPQFSPGNTTRFAWKLTNLGQTPAWITEISSPIGKTVAANGLLPTEPPYEIKRRFPKEGLPMTPNGKLEQFIWVTSDRQSKIEVGKLDLYIFGTIKYRDIFGSKHETRYCFKFNPALGGADPVTRDFVLVEQPNYNRAT